MKRRKRGLDNEGNVADMKERQNQVMLKEDTETRFVNLCHYLHISVMALHINWLGKEQMIELDVQSSEKGQGWELLQSPLILLNLFISSYRYNLRYNTHCNIYKHK